MTTYTIPAGFDLIGFCKNGEHVIMAVTEGWQGTPVPYKNAGVPICEELVAKHPQAFASVADAQAWFMLTHFRNMHNKANSAGQPYPGK
jgi:hypothetical protein